MVTANWLVVDVNQQLLWCGLSGVSQKLPLHNHHVLKTTENNRIKYIWRDLMGAYFSRALTVDKSENVLCIWRVNTTGDESTWNDMG